MKNRIKPILFLTIALTLVLGITFRQTSEALVPGVNQPISVSAAGGNPNSNSGQSSISDNGRFIAFASRATNLVSPATNGQWQIFVRDRLNNSTELVSVSSGGSEANAQTLNPQISSDGRYVVFDSYAKNLVVPNTLGSQNVFIRDVALNETRVASSVNTDWSNTSGRISCEGRFVVYVANHSSDNYLRVADLQNNSVQTLLIATGSSLGLPNISCNGNYIVFNSGKNDIVANDTNAKQDTFIYDQVNAQFERVSIASSGAESNGDVQDRPSVSNDGRYIVFGSSATNLVANDTNSVADIFIRNREANITERLNVTSGLLQANASTYQPSISSDGRYVTYSSSATNLTPGFSYSSGAVYASKSGAEDAY